MRCRLVIVRRSNHLALDCVKPSASGGRDWLCPGARAHARALTKRRTARCSQFALRPTKVPSAMPLRSRLPLSVPSSCNVPL